MTFISPAQKSRKLVHEQQSFLYRNKHLCLAPRESKKINSAQRFDERQKILLRDSRRRKRVVAHRTSLVVVVVVVISLLSGRQTSGRR